MNKKMLFLLFISLQVFAEDHEGAVVLKAFNKHGIIVKTQTAYLKKGHLYVNAEKLSPHQSLTLIDHFKLIVSTRPEEKETCKTGTYQLAVTKGKIIKLEKGCLESARYSELVDHFRYLRKDVLTE